MSGIEQLGWRKLNSSGFAEAMEEIMAEAKSERLGETKGNSQDDLTSEDREHVPCEESK